MAGVSIDRSCNVLSLIRQFYCNSDYAFQTQVPEFWRYFSRLLSLYTRDVLVLFWPKPQSVAMLFINKVVLLNFDFVH